VNFVAIATGDDQETKLASRTGRESSSSGEEEAATENR
jgi:hypothetical protein